ncbi:hypothetical protein NXU94_24440 [Bacteroides faecis]|nr:hypothetical protein [Bacteroides faecis]MCS3070119.1 hypothetical protein [Bacteroides faecis]
MITEGLYQTQRKKKYLYLDANPHSMASHITNISDIKYRDLNGGIG